MSLPVTLAHPIVTSRLSRMGGELRYACAATPASDLASWVGGSCKTFTDVLGRRASGVVRLAESAARGAARECWEALRAGRRGDLIRHLSGRGHSAAGAVHEASKEIAALSVAAHKALKDDPATAAPQFALLVLTSLIVSGGLDGDGGAPDADIALLGIGAHRSPFTHSILMGAALETGLLSLMALVRLLHARLPREHDPIWDDMTAQVDRLGGAANQGVSIGMAYHLLVDGLAQPAAYHGLPIEMPIEMHQFLQAANGGAEAIDVSGKDGGGSRARRATKGDAIDVPGSDGTPQRKAINRRFSGKTASRSAVASKPEAQGSEKTDRALKERHLMAIRRGYCLDYERAQRLSFSAEEVKWLERHGQWCEDLESGKLEPFSDEQQRFISVCRGEVKPQSAHELLWLRYKDCGAGTSPAKATKPTVRKRRKREAQQTSTPPISVDAGPTPWPRKAGMAKRGNDDSAPHAAGESTKPGVRRRPHRAREQFVPLVVGRKPECRA